MKQKVEIEVDVPEGWEAVEYRTPREDEWYLHQHGPARAPCNLAYPWLILRKVEPKRHSQWVSVYPPTHPAYGTPRDTKQGCIGDHVVGLAGLVRYDFEDDKLVAVSLEPLSEEGA